jgi:predicted exporter
MCALRHAKVVVVKLAVSRLLFVEYIMVYVIRWGGTAVYAVVSATVCRWWRRGLPVMLPLARA